MSKNSLDIETIIDYLIEGKTYRQIADILKTPLSTLHDFVSNPEHSARAKTALEISAQTFDDKAEQLLSDAETPFELQKARELGYHYRWKAAKRNPRRFGEKVDLTTQGEKINTTIIKWGDNEIKV